ncbi:unnamed protein product, partial [Effrenium voratum]
LHQSPADVGDLHRLHAQIIGLGAGALIPDHLRVWHCLYPSGCDVPDRRGAPC